MSTGNVTRRNALAAMAAVPIAGAGVAAAESPTIEQLVERLIQGGSCQMLCASIFVANVE